MHMMIISFQRGQGGPKPSGSERKRRQRRLTASWQPFKIARHKRTAAPSTNTHIHTHMHARTHTRTLQKPEQSLFSLSLTMKRKNMHIILSAHFSCHREELFKKHLAKGVQ